MNIVSDNSFLAGVLVAFAVVAVVLFVRSLLKSRNGGDALIPVDESPDVRKTVRPRRKRSIVKIIASVVFVGYAANMAYMFFSSSAQPKENDYSPLVTDEYAVTDSGDEQPTPSYARSEKPGKPYDYDKRVGKIKREARKSFEEHRRKAETETETYARGGAESAAEEKVYTVVDKMPSFPGGEEAMLEYIAAHLKYPAASLEQGVQGVAMLRFVVKPDGGVGKVQVLKSLDPDCDREAERVVRSLPKFTPGVQDGRAVAVWYTLPVRFQAY